MNIRHLAIELPRALRQEHTNVEAKIKAALDSGRFGAWTIEVTPLIPGDIPYTMNRIRATLRKKTAGLLPFVRVRVVVQTAKPIIGRSGFLGPLVFVAAADTSAIFATWIRVEGDIPIIVKNTLEETPERFPRRQTRYQADFEFAKRTIDSVLESTGWFNSGLQFYWLSRNLI